MECELYKSINITHPVTGEHTSTLILVHIKYIHMRKDMLTQRGVIDLTKFKPVARVGDIPRRGKDTGSVGRGEDTRGIGDFVIAMT
ncbi:hypothetical protein F4604DRAFT_1930886 [Suillus subluteus]|nr:hypothetical protein F4604DRAFT_1930886 [Suillus subluteus]